MSTITLAEKLHKDIIAAKAAADKAIESVDDDRGSSNFDSAVLCFCDVDKYGTTRLIKPRTKAIRDVLVCNGGDWMSHFGGYSFSGGAQGATRTEWARVFAEAMKKAGWDAHVRYVMD